MRADGKRAKGVDPLYSIVPHIMTKRYDAMNMITLDIPIKPIREFVRKAREEDVHVSHMAVIIAAYLRTAHEFPRLNRFIVNKRIYDRNEFCVSIVVLKPGDDNATMSKIYFELTDGVYDVQRRIDEFLAKNKVAEKANSTDALISFLLGVPGLLRFGVNFLKFLDRHNMLPKAVINASPFHASMTISNLASIRTNHIYHHLYEFGTTSVFIAMGNQREVPMLTKGADGDKAVTMVRCIPLGVVMDERICSGSYFAGAFKKMRAYFANPSLLRDSLQK